MKVGEALTSTFRFRKTSLTILIVITYALIVILERLTYYNSLNIPKSEPPILSKTWEHLQIISSSKHPFTSPKNDELHDYLEDVIREKINGLNYTEVSSDKLNNHTIFINQHDVFDKNNDANRIIYYESSNLLVKIQGSDKELPGLLISAHFDSVPTSFGTTDDGMGVASMLAVLQYIVEKGEQPVRTIVFNFNNNEEFGLLGAEAFVKHEWFKEVGFFVNLEGTGAGGRPVLFRGTDKSVVDWYSYVSKPFANSIFQEGFKSGFISSQTDYHVYEGNGLRGLDIAFYLPRSYYHTIRDSIEYTTKESLWMMAHTVIEIVDHVGYSNDGYDDELSYSLYFDIGNHWFVNLSVVSVFIYNVILLCIVPLIIISLLITVLKGKKWTVGIRGWMRFPLVILISYYTKSIFTKYMWYHNPMLVSTNFTTIGVFYFTATLLISYTILSIANKVAPVDDQKLIIMLEMNVITWCALAWMTYKQKNEANTAGYCFSIVYFLTSLAVFVGLFGKLLRKRVEEHVERVPADESEVEVADGHNIVDQEEEEGEGEEEVGSGNEMQPLLGRSEEVVKEVEEDFEYDWLVQYIIFVPISVFFIYSEGLLIIEALADTVLQSSEYDEAVWSIIAIFAIMSAVVIAPFAHKINNILFQVVILGLCVSFGICYWSNGFSREHPIKVRFVESFDVNSNSSMANIYGRAGYLKGIVNELPYLNLSDVSIENGTVAGTEHVMYEGFRPWLLEGSIADNEFDKYLNVSVISGDGKGGGDRYAPVNSEVEIEVAGARQCYMTFNTSNEKFKAPVKMVTVMRESEEDYKEVESVPNGMSRDSKGNWVYKVMKGVDIVELHRVRWHAPFTEVNKFKVKLQWLPFLYDNDVEMIDNLGVKVQCHWSDYDEVVVVDGVQEVRVRNFVDLLQYSSGGVVWENYGPGLVRGEAYVEL